MAGRFELDGVRQRFLLFLIGLPRNLGPFSTTHALGLVKHPPPKHRQGRNINCFPQTGIATLPPALRLFRALEGPQGEGVF